MAVKLLSYCTVLFFGMMLFLIIKEPYTINELGIDGKLVPDIELFNAKNYQIKEGSIASIVSSTKVERYPQLDKLYGVNAEHKTDKGINGRLLSDEATLKEGIIYFMQNTHYQRDDGIGLEGNAIQYNLKEKILSSDKPFVFTQAQSRSDGNSFVYQMKEGTISAQTIHSVIQVGKK